MTETKTTGTHWKKNFNYNFLGAYSIEEGNDLILTIKDTKTELVKNQKGEEEPCFTCYFVENPKPMILNKTNCKQIEKLFGTPMIEDWKGKKIQLYSARISAFGQETDCLRVRDFRPDTPKLDTAPIIKRLKACKDLKTLQAEYNTLSGAFKADSEVLLAKDELKKKLK